MRIGEARALADRGLALLASTPDDGVRRGVELELQMTRALALKTALGYAVPEVGQAYRRARELSRQVQDPGQVIPVLMGLSAHYIAGGEIGVAYELAEQLLELAERVDDRHVLMIAEWCVRAALHHKGSLRQAHEHLARALELYDPEFHKARAWQVGIEPGIFCQCETARTLLLLGRPDESAARITRAEQQARALGHPQTLAFVLLFRMLLHHLREDAAPVLALHDELAVAVLDAARAVGRATDQQMFAAEWHRLVGQARLARDPASLDEAQAAFDDAMEVARWQGSKLLEGRARAALARLADDRQSAQRRRQDTTA